MSDPTTEKLENLTIQDNNITTTTEFDPYSPGSPLESQNAPQTVDLLGDLNQDQITNGLDSMSVDPYAGQTDGQNKPADSGLGRKMSEREVIGYQQNDYGGTFQSSTQMEYNSESDEEDKNNFGASAQPPMAGEEEQYYRSTGQPVIEVDREEDMLSSDKQVYSPDSSQIPSEDYLGSPDESSEMLSPVRDQNMDYIDPENWAPHTDPLHARRSRSPERSLSPPTHGDNLGGMHDDTKEASAPRSDENDQDESNVSDNRPEKKVLHKVGHIPRPQSSPKIPRAKKPLELPPWNDNVVIPKPPRMKPTLIGKQPETPPSPSRPKTAPSSLQYRKPDASSDSGVEEDKASGKERKASADSKRKYGTDTKNIRYKPGGGHVKIFNEKIDTTTVAPRTDSKPRAPQSPRGNTPEKSPMSPKPPTPNVKNVQSKIGSLDNARHSPGGGNVKVVSAKVDFSKVHSKVGSKDKIDHKPKGGDKKILDQKVEVKAQSKVGSTANIKHKAGGGDKKIETVKVDFTASAKSKVGSMDNVKHKATGGDIKIYDEKLEFTEKAGSKVGSMDKVTHKPGGGDKKIETQKLAFKETAKARTDTGHASGAEKKRSATSSRSDSIASEGSVGTQ